MALKDWKKIDNFPSIIYQKGNTAIHIVKQGIFEKNIYNPNKTEYAVLLKKDTNKYWVEKSLKYLKTKSAALKFAKSYMRSH